MNDKRHIIRRHYQQSALREFVRSDARFWAFLWERQSGKSTTFADFALYEMFKYSNRTVIYGSASLLLAQELPIKTAIRANQTITQIVENDSAILKQFAETAQSAIDAQDQHPLPPQDPFKNLLIQFAAQDQLKLQNRHSRINEFHRRACWRENSRSSRRFPVIEAKKTTHSSVEFKTYDATTGKEIIGGRGASAKQISADDFTELFSQQRLEFRVYHDRGTYSRTKVIAPNIATARSWSGTVLLDEVAFIRNLRELITALLPVISTDKQFKLILSTTPPEFDDTHYSFELLAPPANCKFEPNPEGNWYTSESGVRVHRADAFDTSLAGKKIYDLKTGAEISPAQAFTRAPNKDGHRIAHWLTWMLGGSAACDLLRLRTAQERGAGQCQNFQITTDMEMTKALNWLAAHYLKPETLNLKPSLALGFDVATTTKGKSNPSVLSIMEERGPEWLVRARFIWRIADPETANQRIESILDTLQRCGIRPRGLAQDATNERYYGEQNLKRFRRRLPVILIVANQSVDKPGLDKPTNWKEYLGNQLVAKLDDNNLTLPPDDYTRVDYRLVMRDRGKFICEPNDQGMHGDCFDADKYAGHALTNISSRRTIVLPPEILEEWLREAKMPSTMG